MKLLSIIRHLASLTAVLLATSLPPVHAEASCGLEYCPVQYDDEPSDDDWGLRIPTSVRVAGFSYPWMREDSSGGFSRAEQQGFFTQTQLGFEYRPIEDLYIMGQGSWVVLNWGDDYTEDSTGLGNPILMSEYYVLSDDSWTLGVGAQMEFPLGNSEDGIASDHFEMLPYLHVTWRNDLLHVDARVGGRFALNSHGDDATTRPPVANHFQLTHEGGVPDNNSAVPHDHADHDHGAPVHINFVSPHGDSEVVYRLGVGTTVIDDLTPMLFVDGQEVLDESAAPSESTFVNVGAGLIWNATELLSVTANAEAPIVNERYAWRTSLGVVFSL